MDLDNMKNLSGGDASSALDDGQENWLKCVYEYKTVNVQQLFATCERDGSWRKINRDKWRDQEGKRDAHNRILYVTIFPR